MLQAAFGEIMDGAATPAQIAGLLVALRTKGETVGEIVAAARALRARAETAPLPDPRCVDTCGTGGDGAGTLNVSTIAAFVVAGAGVPVAKHGNRAASGKTGSADRPGGPRGAGGPAHRGGGAAGGRGRDRLLLCAARPPGDAPRGAGARGARPAHDHELPRAARSIPSARGASSSASTTRRCVAPLAEALAALGAERALVVHGDDGLDELTTTTTSTTALWNGRELVPGRVDPEALGLPLAAPEALRGGDAARSAAIARAVLAGERGPERDIVLLNAAAALLVADAAESLAQGLRLAAQSVDSGAARARLEALVRAGRRAAAGEAR